MVLTHLAGHVHTDASRLYRKDKFSCLQEKGLLKDYRNLFFGKNLLIYWVHKILTVRQTVQVLKVPMQ